MVFPVMQFKAVSFIGVLKGGTKQLMLKIDKDCEMVHSLRPQRAHRGRAEFGASGALWTQ
jgi:hypothetical protein